MCDVATPLVFRLPPRFSHILKSAFVQVALAPRRSHFQKFGLIRPPSYPERSRRPSQVEQQRYDSRSGAGGEERATDAAAGTGGLAGTSWLVLASGQGEAATAGQGWARAQAGASRTTWGTGGKGKNPGCGGGALEMAPWSGLCIFLPSRPGAASSSVHAPAVTPPG